MLDDDTLDPACVEFLRKTAAILKMLLADSVATAGKFAAACGRQKIVAKDTVYALKYEARVFFDKDDLERRFEESLAEEREHSYETDDDDESDEEDDEEEDEEDDEEDEAYTTEFAVGDAQFHQTVLRIAQDWNAWEPTDPVKSMLKRAIDKTELQMCAHGDATKMLPPEEDG